MSTTVTYKGQTLTTVENQTKTLNTAGTWVEGDIGITDQSVDISDTTATASDVADGKVFYSANGTRTTGTASGGGGATWTKTVTITEPVTSGSNNAEALLKTIEPELNSDNTNGVYTFYTFEFSGNTITNKGAIFAAWMKMGGLQPIFETYRTPSRWGSAMDFYVSAGTEVKVTRYDIFTYGG